MSETSSRGRDEVEPLRVPSLLLIEMEGLGLLTRGIAHDMNNLLTAIFGYIELAKNTLEPTHPAYHYLDNILSASEMAAGLTSQMLSVVDTRVVEPQTVNLNAMILKIGRLLSPLLSEPIRSEMRLQADLWPVKINPSQLTQVILNLVLNARDAMPEGGHLTIETHNLLFDAEATHTLTGVESGAYVVLTVSDTGKGRDAKVPLPMTEPLFAPKESRMGTGLGLAALQGIIRQGRGFLLVESAAGQGTTIHVHLPAETQTSDEEAVENVERSS